MLRDVADGRGRAVFQKLAVEIAVEVAHRLAVRVLPDLRLDQLHQLDDLSAHGYDHRGGQKRHIPVIQHILREVDGQKLSHIVAAVRHSGRHEAQLLLRHLIPGVSDVDF